MPAGSWLPFEMLSPEMCFFSALYFFFLIILSAGSRVEEGEHIGRGTGACSLFALYTGVPGFQLLAGDEFPSLAEEV